MGRRPEGGVEMPRVKRCRPLGILRRPGRVVVGSREEAGEGARGPDTRGGACGRGGVATCARLGTPWRGRGWGRGGREIPRPGWVCASGANARPRQARPQRRAKRAPGEADGEGSQRERELKGVARRGATRRRAAGGGRDGASLALEKLVPAQDLNFEF